MELPDASINAFREAVWAYYDSESRQHLPWRQTSDPYRILVSEIMLQQTQVDRVIPKYEAFLELFPTSGNLAQAPLADVLRSWQGLGYNRRARFLHEAAKMIEVDMAGIFPRSQTELIRLPGVGVNTAGAILAYAFNVPVVYIETNVRTVLLHHFFKNESDVSDKALLDVAARVVDMESPREWYWALMDYGSHLKRAGNGGLQRSAAHKPQPPLRGSVREVRGAIIRSLASISRTHEELASLVEADERFEVALKGLIKDGLIEEVDGRIRLTV